MKYSFKNDYSYGCHPNILAALAASNMSAEDGYGFDAYSIEAAALIKKLVGSDPDVFFVSGGTQANLTIISTILRPYESVISASTGHIQVHEAGAIEATGHRIQAVNTPNGKLTVEDIKGQLVLFEEVHTTIPRLVYLSNSTETGTIYLKSELMELHTYCRSVGLLLFLDGARLFSALASRENDITYLDLGRYTDVFYIGGTKAGALLGEAIVINNASLKENFVYNLKQKGALLAKGRILGIQFRELFKDNLFLRIGEYANQMAYELESAILEMGFNFLSNTSTNQIFPILPNRLIAALKENYEFYVWQKIDDHHSAIRLVTCWATEKSRINLFISDLKRLSNSNA